MLEAAVWGVVGSSSLVIGALLGLRLRLSQRSIALALAFGAGTLVSAVSLELADEALTQGGAGSLALGLAIGALAYYAGDVIIERRAHAPMQRPHGQDSSAPGSTLALGALLDGVPEQAAIGLSIAVGGEVGIALVAAVFLSNVPEALGSAAAMRAGGRSAGTIVRLWLGVALCTTLATVVGYVALSGASGRVTGTILAVAAGSVLVMLTDTMIPEAVKEGGRRVGLVTVLGFAVAVLLSSAG